MTLKDYYEEAKRKNIPISVWVCTTLISLGIIAFYMYVIYLGWHLIISKVFNWPDMTYIQVVCTIIWISLTKNLIFWGMDK